MIHLDKKASDLTQRSLKIPKKHVSILLFGLIVLSSCYNQKKIEKEKYSENIKGYWGVTGYPRATFIMLDSTVVYPDTTFFILPEQQYYIKGDSLFFLGGLSPQKFEIIKCNKKYLFISQDGPVKKFIRFKNDTVK